jgi:hypothetical protein
MEAFEALMTYGYKLKKLDMESPVCHYFVARGFHNYHLLEMLKIYLATTADGFT